MCRACWRRGKETENAGCKEQHGRSAARRLHGGQKNCGRGGQHDIAGGSIITCPIDPETDEPLCDAELVSAMSQDVLLDNLGKALGFHWPNFAAIFEKMRESEVDFCQFCGEDLQKCMLCPFNSYNN